MNDNTSARTQRKPTTRISTGIAGLDEIISGGLTAQPC